VVKDAVMSNKQWQLLSVAVQLQPELRVLVAEALVDFEMHQYQCYPLFCLLSKLSYRSAQNL
jgi:hypothetical protein